jgi:hypothetical protein
MSMTSKVIISSLAYHGEQSIWEKHISDAYVTNAVYDTKMQAWYDTYMEMEHAYVHQQLQAQKEEQLQAILANEQM